MERITVSIWKKKATFYNANLEIHGYDTKLEIYNLGWMGQSGKKRAQASKT